MPPELWTLLLAQNVPVCVACDLKYCEDCPRAAQIGELLFTKAIEIAEAQTGENVHFDREIPEYVPPWKLWSMTNSTVVPRLTA